MAKPRRATLETWYDVYSDMTLEDQAAALKILEQVHRLAVRESRRPKQTAADAEVDRQRELLTGRDDVDDRTPREIGEERCPPRT